MCFTMYLLLHLYYLCIKYVIFDFIVGEIGQLGTLVEIVTVKFQQRWWFVFQEQYSQ